MSSFLNNPVCIAELHRLLWVDEFVNNGTYDSAWSCRDHAFVISCLLLTDNTATRIVHGKNMFVQGPNGDLPPVALGQASDAHTAHSWLISITNKVLDVSPRLHLGPKRWRPVKFTGISTMNGRQLVAGR